MKVGKEHPFVNAEVLGVGFMDSSGACIREVKMH
jgi:hypothetical protein